MKRLTFNVKLENNKNKISFIKEIDKISCRININFEEGLVQVEDVTEEFLNKIIDLVDNYFEIQTVKIDNVLDSSKKLLTENGTSSSEGFVNNSNEAVQNNTGQDSPNVMLDDECDGIESDKVVKASGDDDNNYTEEVMTQIALPQSKDDLIVKKVEFEDLHIEELLNKLAKTMYWLFFQKKISSITLDRFFYSFMNELSINFSSKEIIETQIGDVVSCNFGQHIPGEINGFSVSAIVCHYLGENMAYVVPITKTTENITSISYLPIDVPSDVVYKNKTYSGGVALLDKGKYVRMERFNEVIGNVNPCFFIRLLTELSTTFDFTKEILTNTTVADDVMIQNDNLVESSRENSLTTVVSEKKPAGIIEEAINKEFGVYLGELDKTKPVEEQIKSFMDVLEMSESSKFFFDSFEIALKLDKINYENLIVQLKERYPSIKEVIIKASLKEDFKKWLKKYPELEKCSKISIIAILKEFAKRFK